MGCAFAAPAVAAPPSPRAAIARDEPRTRGGAAPPAAPKLHLREMLVHEHVGVDPWKETFEKVRLLGAGLSGSVFLVRNKKTGATFA